MKKTFESNETLQAIMIKQTLTLWGSLLSQIYLKVVIN